MDEIRMNPIKLYIYEHKLSSFTEMLVEEGSFLESNKDINGLYIILDEDKSKFYEEYKKYLSDKK